MRLSREEKRTLEAAAAIRNAKPHDITRVVLLRWARRILAKGEKL